MWLLNTATAEQKFFADPNDVPGGYAILSHVWDKNEDSFQSVRDAVKMAKGEATLEQEVATLKNKIKELEDMTTTVVEAAVEAAVKAAVAAITNSKAKEKEAVNATVVPSRALDVTITNSPSLAEMRLSSESS